jgi:hypothetical protein
MLWNYVDFFRFWSYSIHETRFESGENIMETKLNNTEEAKKVWVTPELVVHGDVEDITKESPGISGYKPTSPGSS